MMGQKLNNVQTIKLAKFLGDNNVDNPRFLQTFREGYTTYVKDGNYIVETKKDRFIVVLTINYLSFRNAAGKTIAEETTKSYWSKEFKFD